MKHTFRIAQQTYPASEHCWFLIEVVLTKDGYRSRLCQGRWKTFDEAKKELDRHVEEK